MAEFMVHDKGAGRSGGEFIRQAERMALRRGHPTLFGPNVWKCQTTPQQLFGNHRRWPLVELHVGKSQTTLWARTTPGWRFKGQVCFRRYSFQSHAEAPPKLLFLHYD